jgi:hypothetical protein
MRRAVAVPHFDAAWTGRGQGLQIGSGRFLSRWLRVCKELAEAGCRTDAFEVGKPLCERPLDEAGDLICRSLGALTAGAH